VDHGSLETVAGAKRWFFEQLRKNASGKQLRPFPPAKEAFEFFRFVEYGDKFVGIQIKQGSEMLHDAASRSGNGDERSQLAGSGNEKD
jgi:hypothetical protein